MEFNLINEAIKDRKTVKTSFDWPSFFSFWIYGIPHFLRGQNKIGILLIVIGIISTVFLYLPGATEAEQAITALGSIIFSLSLSIYMGRNGRKLFTKHLLAAGYSFEDEQSEVVNHYKRQWGIM